MNSTILFIVNGITHLLPSTRCFAFKRFLYRLTGLKIGRNVRICSSVRFIGDKTITIADNVWIGHETMIIASAPIFIGPNVNIAPRCFIGTGTHEIDPLGVSIAGKGCSLPITIHEGAWLCTHSIIIAGVEVGRKAVTAAGSVVVKNVPDGEMWGGVPARYIKTVI